jgi:O-antigen ligase
MPVQTAAQHEYVPARRRYTPDALLYVTAAFLWVSVWRIQDLWPIIGKLQISILLEILLFATLVISLKGARKLKWVRSRIFAVPFLLLAIMMVGLPFSLWRGFTAIFILKSFMPSLLLMIAVAVSIRESEDLNWLAFAHLVGGTIYSVWVYLFVAMGSNGRLNDLVYYDANDFALLIVCTIPVAVYFLQPSMPVWKRLFSLFALALFVQMIIKSGSRGGFIALIGLMAYVLIAFRAIPTRLRVSATAIGFLIMVVLGSSAYWTMMSSILHPREDYNMTSEEGRKAIWKRGVGYMLKNPVVGVGASAFEQAEGTLSDVSRQYANENRGLKWSTAHNSFVLVGAELGVGGLVLFVTMLGMSFTHLNYIQRTAATDPLVTPEDAAFSQTLIASLIGFCIAGFFVSATYFSFLYALIGLIVAEDSLRARRRARGAGAPAAIATPKSTSTVQVAQRVPRTHWAPTG